MSDECRTEDSEWSTKYELQFDPIACTRRLKECFTTEQNIEKYVEVCFVYQIMVSEITIQQSSKVQGKLMITQNCKSDPCHCAIWTFCCPGHTFKQHMTQLTHSSNT